METLGKAEICIAERLASNDGFCQGCNRFANPGANLQPHPCSHVPAQGSSAPCKSGVGIRFLLHMGTEKLCNSNSTPRYSEQHSPCLTGIACEDNLLRVLRYGGNLIFLLIFWNSCIIKHGYSRFTFAMQSTTKITTSIWSIECYSNYVKM